MKTLKNFLSPKSKWHPDRGFPKSQCAYDIIEFLKKEGFTEIFNTDRDNCSYIKFIANNMESFGGPIFITDPELNNKINSKQLSWIRFCNPGKLSESNPIFFYRVGKSKNPPEEQYHIGLTKLTGVGFIETDTSIANGSDIQVDTVDEFAKEVNNHFGW